MSELKESDLHLEGYTVAERLQGISLLLDPCRSDIVRYASQRITALESQRAQTTALLNAGAERVNTLEAALRRALICKGHEYNCSSARGSDRDCTCGWMEVMAALHGEPKP